MRCLELARRLWAEWAPSYVDGRLDLGPLVVMSRRRLSIATWEAMDMGIKSDLTSDLIAQHVAEMRGEAHESAAVRHLRVV